MGLASREPVLHREADPWGGVSLSWEGARARALAESKGSLVSVLGRGEGGGVQPGTGPRPTLCLPGPPRGRA